MHKRGIYTVAENMLIARGTYLMRLVGDTRYIVAPGQFINIELDGFYLRRPISICDWSEDGITIIYKVLGEGTRLMAGMTAGQKLDVLTGLGNGFSISESVQAPLFVGGGVGVPPLYGLAKRMADGERAMTVVLGYNSAEDAFLAEEFKKLGANVIISTVDGSAGTRGFVTDAIGDEKPAYDYVYACGPMAMLEALHKSAAAPGQYSFEERMGCGFGICMGCSCQVKYGYKRICVEGPVLASDEIIW